MREQGDRSRGPLGADTAETLAVDENTVAPEFDIVAPPPEGVEKLRGLRGSLIEPPGDVGASGKQKAGKVEAMTLLGDPRDPAFAPRWVVRQLQQPSKPTVSDRINLACALAWLGFSSNRSGNKEAALASFDDALRELGQAKVLASGKDIDVIDRYASVITRLRA